MNSVVRGLSGGGGGAHARKRELDLTGDQALDEVLHRAKPAKRQTGNGWGEFVSPHSKSGSDANIRLRSD